MLCGDATELDASSFHHVVGRSHGFVALLESDCLSGDQNGNFMDIVGNEMRLGGAFVISDSSHRVPLRYDYSGAISLDQCGIIAQKSDLDVLGFLWGARNHIFNSSVADLDSSGADAVPHTLQHYSNIFSAVPRHKFGCSIIVGNTTSLDTRFSCGDAADLCDQLQFHPALAIPDVAGKHANAVCCQQFINNMGVEQVTVNEFWLAYTRTATYNSSCEPIPDEFAVTKPGEKSAVYWLELVMYFIVSTRSTPVMSLHPYAILYWYLTLWANCAASMMAASRTGMLGAQHGWVMFFLHILKTQMLTFFAWTLPMTCLKQVPNRRMFSMGMILVGSFWTSFVIDRAYDPLYVTLLGHHVIVLGVFSFLVTIVKMPFQTWVKEKFCGVEQQSRVYKLCTGQLREAMSGKQGEYWPWFYELNRPIPDSLGLEAREIGMSGSVLPLLYTIANDDNLQDDPVLNTTGSDTDLWGDTTTKSKLARFCGLLL